MRQNTGILLDKDFCEVKITKRLRWTRLNKDWICRTQCVMMFCNLFLLVCLYCLTLWMELIPLKKSSSSSSSSHHHHAVYLANSYLAITVRNKPSDIPTSSDVHFQSWWIILPTSGCTFNGALGSYNISEHKQSSVGSSILVNPRHSRSFCNINSIIVVRLFLFP